MWYNIAKNDTGGNSMNFAKEDDVNGVFGVAKMLMFAVEIEPNNKIPIICSHPYTNITQVPICDKTGITKVYDLTKKEDFEEWSNSILTKIKRMNIDGIFLATNTAYRITLLKYAKDYLTKSTFSKLFGDIWVESEDPNNDANVSLAELVKWFKISDKTKLMNEEDYHTWLSFPETLTIYRGVAVGRKPYGLSWTTEKEKAEWFAHRYDTEKKAGYVQYVEIQKNEALAYFNTRDEKEVVVDGRKIKDRINKF